MSIIYILHIIVQLFIISLPFFPLNILKKGLYILPLLITFQWLMFDGCILTLVHKKNKNEPDFMHGILKKIINNNITKQQAENFNSLLLVLIVTIIAYRFKINK